MKRTPLTVIGAFSIVMSEVVIGFDCFDDPKVSGHLFWVKLKATESPVWGDECQKAMEEIFGQLMGIAHLWAK